VDIYIENFVNKEGPPPFALLSSITMMYYNTQNTMMYYNTQNTMMANFVQKKLILGPKLVMIWRSPAYVFISSTKQA
jgi:hypothetical protein